MSGGTGLVGSWWSGDGFEGGVGDGVGLALEAGVGRRVMSRARRASAAAARRHSTMVGESNMALLRISAAFC